MKFTKEQISELMCKHAQKENGLQDLFEIMLESMMVAERSEFLSDNQWDKGNGFRPGHTYGHGKRLEFRIPRDRYGNFHPRILAILRDQEEECDRLAGVLYTKGLTQEQVGDVFDEIYGQHYSRSSISRMVESVRTQVSQWMERSLDEYYPIVFVDCNNSKAISEGAFYDLMWCNPWYNNFDPEFVYAFLRYTGNEHLLIVVNFNRNECRDIQVKVPEDALQLMGFQSHNDFGMGGFEGEHVQLHLAPSEVKIIDFDTKECLI